jgi:SAM-dependent methyltransferase
MALSRRQYERAYRRGKAPWDTGIPPPELVELIEGPNALEPGHALDLGCGTGTNVIYLVQHGWRAVGIDFSSLAIESARRKSDWVSGAVFLEGDVTRLSDLGVDGPFDLLLDIGCFHSVVPSRRDAYVREVTRVARPGSLMMIFAFGPRLRLRGSRRTRASEIRRRFSWAFDLERVRPGSHPPGAAWFFLRRRG